MALINALHLHSQQHYDAQCNIWMDQSARQQLSHWNSTVKQSNLFVLPLQPLKQPNAMPIKTAASLTDRTSPSVGRNQTAAEVTTASSSTHPTTANSNTTA